MNEAKEPSSSAPRTGSPRALRFTLLGSGTSSGVPVIGCDCDVCRSNDPRDRRLRSGSCLELIDGQGVYRVILFDTSPDLREQALRLGLKRCDAIFFTHHHVDHVFGLDEVRRFNALMSAPINIYADLTTLTNLKRVYQHIFDAPNNVNQSFVASLIPNVLEVGRSVTLFGLRFLPVRLLHGRMPIIGYRVDFDQPGFVPFWTTSPVLPLGYCTDVSSIPPETLRTLTGLNTLFLDALRYRHHPTHFNIDQAIDTARRLDARQTYFVHMTHDIRHDDLTAQLPERIAPSYDGLRLGTLEPMPAQQEPESIT